MLLVSWNVNGIRACHDNLLRFIKTHSPDVISLQEIKSKEIPLDIRSLNYFQYWYPAEREGYSGTGVLSKIKPRRVKYGMGIKKFDREGRVITLDFKDFYLINAYFPNARRDLSRLKFKLEFDEAFLKYVKRLRKPKIICGDFNVAHEEIDLANPTSNREHAGFTDEERKWMTKFLSSGFVDTFRMFVKEGGHYTYWTYMFNARKRNIGWRIDYFIVSKELKDKVKKSWIFTRVYGSDHAPIGLEVKI